MTLESIKNRLEKLEQTQDGGWDYSVTYFIGYGEDEDAIRESALAKYRAEHGTRPDDEVLLIRVAFVLLGFHDSRGAFRSHRQRRTA